MPILNDRASWNRTCYMGASAKALVMAAAERRYRLAAVEPGFDLFFVRHDVFARWQRRSHGASGGGRGGGAGGGGGRHTMKADAAVSESGAPTGVSVLRLLEKALGFGAPSETAPSSVPPSLSLPPELSTQLAARNTEMFPMTPEEASNLMDYEVYSRTSSLCQARAAATKLLRAYASAHHKEFQAHENKRGWARQCFKHLRHLQLAPCDEAATIRSGMDQLGHMVG